MSSVLFNIFGYWCIYSIFREFYQPRRGSLRILYRIKILVMKQLVYRPVFIIVCANDVSKRPVMIGHLCFVCNMSLVEFLESGRHHAIKCWFMSFVFYAVQNSWLVQNVRLVQRNFRDCQRNIFTRAGVQFREGFGHCLP